MKQEDVSALFGFKCAIVYAIGEFQTNEKSLKLNETIYLLFYDNDDNLLRDNELNFSEKIWWWAFLVASEEVSLVANADVEVGTVLSTKENKILFW